MKPLLLLPLLLASIASPANANDRFCANKVKDIQSQLQFLSDRYKIKGYDKAGELIMDNIGKDALLLNENCSMDYQSLVYESDIYGEVLQFQIQWALSQPLTE